MIGIALVDNSKLLMESSSPFMPGFSGIRRLAVLWVVFQHSVIYDDFNWLREAGMRAGYIGGGLIFVLSGYLIPTLLLKEEAQTGTTSVPPDRVRLGLVRAHGSAFHRENERQHRPELSADGHRFGETWVVKFSGSTNPPGNGQRPLLRLKDKRFHFCVFLPAAVTVQAIPARTP